MQDSVPIIDIAALETPAALDAIDRACREWGFFQVTGHGIPATLTDGVLEAARRFFAEPRAAKRRILRSADNPYGYYDRELTKNAFDRKEVFDTGPGDGGSTVPQWPAGLPGFRSAVTAYYRACEDLARRLLGALARNLGVPPAELLHDFGDGHTSFLRLNYYPAEGGTPDGDRPFGVGQHSDAGALTVLLQDDRPGLEICRDDRWYPVTPTPGAFVINIGDIVQVWSNDRYRAAQHRVIASSRRDRYSVPYFMNPTWEATYAPLPPAVTADRPARYRPIPWREFRALRAAGDYADLGEEVQIGNYRL